MIFSCSLMNKQQPSLMHIIHLCNDKGPLSPETGNIAMHMYVSWHRGVCLVQLLWRMKASNCQLQPCGWAKVETKVYMLATMHSSSQSSLFHYWFACWFWIYAIRHLGVNIRDCYTHYCTFEKCIGSVLDDFCVQLLITMDGGCNHSMGSPMDGTPPQSEDR